MLQEFSVLDKCVCVFLFTCVKIQQACIYNAIVACYSLMAKCMYLGLSNINVLYVFNSVESQGSCADEIVVVMKSAPCFLHADKI